MSDNDKPEPDNMFSNDSSVTGKSSDQVTQEAPKKRSRRAASRPAGAPDAAGVPLFQAPPEAPAEPKPKKKATKKPKKNPENSGDSAESSEDSGANSTDTDSGEQGSEGGVRKRRRRGGRKRKKPGISEDSSGAEEPGQSDDADLNGDKGSDDSDQNNGSNSNGEGQGTSSSARRRRRRKRTTGEGGQGANQGSAQSQGRKRNQSDKVTGVKGSTRLEAKKQRRREGREAGRRRTPVLTEAEFLARRESVKRKMIVRQIEKRVQIAVLEDDVLAEHYVSSTTNTSMVGNVYLGRVQNVLPSMEAAFIDIGRGRNAVLYAGEVNWSAAGLEGQPKRIELALKSGDAVMVQVTKDPVGQKGARLTGQISLPGRFLVYVPEGSMTGISRRLPDRERARLKKLLKAALPENSGVIVRTAAEGASEDQVNADISRLTEQWESIQKKASSGKAPSVLYSEPDLATRVVRDIFNEDFESLTVSGDEVAATIKEYLETVSPELGQKVSKWTKNEDVFAASRVDEQLAKALDRKVWLPSGGSLVIDHTEAMTVVDVNTGRFTGQGGNLEETVTENNLEAAEEIARQLRLRDVGGIIVVDFIDMVLESNRDLVLRRLIECLGRDRTKHQVAEVTSLGLVQMTRKRIGQGLLETFSDDCEACNGRGVKVHMHPVDRVGSDDTPPPVRRQRPTGPIPGAPTNKGPNANASDATDAAPGAEGADDIVDESSSPDDALDDVDLTDVDSSEVEEAAEVARDKASGKDLINVAVGVVVDEVDIDEDDDLDDDDESQDDDDDSSDEDHILELESADDPA